jgi:hypothetical protein
MHHTSDPKTLAQAFTAEAISAAVQIMRNPLADPATRLRAASLLLAQGHGTPAPRPAPVQAAKDIGRALAGMTDAQLLEVAHAARDERHRAEGGGEQNGGPHGVGVIGVPTPIASSPERNTLGAERNTPSPRQQADTPHPLDLQKTGGGGQNGTLPPKNSLDLDLTDDEAQQVL